MNNIEQRIKKIVAEQLGLDENEIKNEQNLITDLGSDSLDLVELVMAVEDDFGLEISNEDAERLDTVQKLIDYVSANATPA